MPEPAAAATGAMGATLPTDGPRGTADPGGRRVVMCQRTFSVARPIIARIRLMIQNRMTICGSAQPRFSKW